ncbi:hypothetical protein MNBD_GAMMA11-2754 [hydrothermal vent metagenome]|uniref:Cytoskeleton protein RodZ-like C-terminal domain-containing protein n=1 Tax=hydrothermal vent metagenome TaxID=652676 RepID=A0A3B0WXH4_9ZZZZ
MDRQAHHKSDVDSLLSKKEFGSELKQARRALSMSITDVADKLLVSEDIIKAIENSQSDKLPALTFTKGYIRSYARLVAIPADKIISAYLSVAPEQSSSLSSRTALPSQASSNHFFIQVITIAVVVFAVVGFFFWVFQTDFSLHKPDIAQDDVQAVSAQPDSLVTEVISSDTDELPDKPVLLKTDSSQQNTQRPVVVNEVAKRAPVLNNKRDADESHSEVSAGREGTVAGDIDKTTVIKPLVLTAIKASWVEVKDAHGLRLYYQLLDAGKEISLQGVPPYAVFLGNARQVRAEINNEIVAFDQLLVGNRKTVHLIIEADAQVRLGRRP